MIIVDPISDENALKFFLICFIFILILYFFVAFFSLYIYEINKKDIDDV